MFSIDADMVELFRMFHRNMLARLDANGRREPAEALSVWKESNDGKALISPLPFNKIAGALLACQASLTPVERIFGDLGRA